MLIKILCVLRSFFPTWLAVLAMAQPVVADPLKEPPVIASSGGVLDLLVVAKSMPVPSISFSPMTGGASVNPTAWLYEICQRPPSLQCPAGSGTLSDYGGVRLALKAGDVLKVRLVNKLPSVEKAKLKHVIEPGQANLFRNPTNLHTHGLIVPPRAPTLNDPTFGDYIFVEIYNSANGLPVPEPNHQHGSVKMDFADYRIDIPNTHPPGLFWFHPHIHGLSLNQVSAGMAGIITIGSVTDYIPNAPMVIRHLVLKDMQVLAAGTLQYSSGRVTVTDGEVQNQQIAEFCEQFDRGGPMSRQGFCEGAPDEHGNGNSFIHSKWYFTVNGQVFPTVHLTSPDGELWRITNASAQVSYRLNLVDNSTQAPMPLQLVAIDGVSITVPSGTPVGTALAMGANRFTLANCPLAGSSSVLPICVKDLIMMPSARAEVWVTYRDSAGTAVAPPPGATATLKQQTINLGPAAEGWPEVKLAKIEFSYGEVGKTAVEVAGHASSALSSDGILGHPALKGAVAPSTAACSPLASGHRRRIFFGMEDAKNPQSPFGLGYEEVDDIGAVVPGTHVPVSAYDAAKTLVCLPLGPGGTLVKETWELVNLATETHNFHIHQTKFRVLDATGINPLLQMNATVPSAAILEDNIPLPFAIANIPDLDATQNGYCTIAQWRSGECSARPVVLDIPFSQRGEFVFHCHILEHEDGGMMAKISVE